MEETKQRQGFTPDNPETWKKEDRDALGVARAILSKPKGFVRRVKGRKSSAELWEAIQPGEWTSFDSRRLSPTVFEFLRSKGEIVAAQDKPDRWVAPR